MPPDRWGVCADLARGLGGYETRLYVARALEGENCWSHSLIAFARNNISATSLLTSTSSRNEMAINNKENEAYSLKIARLQREKEYHEEILRQRCEVVEALKKEKKRLEASVRAKEAIAAARRK